MTQDTPLSGLKPTTLDEYFSMSPEQITPDIEDKIIAELRHRRTIWRQAEAQGATKAPRTPKASGTAVVDLKDLGL